LLGLCQPSRARLDRPEPLDECASPTRGDRLDDVAMLAVQPRALCDQFGQPLLDDLRALGDLLARLGDDRLHERRVTRESEHAVHRFNAT
jgi:hypothetical protein